MSSLPPEPNQRWQPPVQDFQSAPPYGRPPRKSRAGLIIALIAVLTLVALAALGILAYRLVTNHTTNATSPPTSQAPSPASTPGSSPGASSGSASPGAAARTPRPPAATTAPTAGRTGVPTGRPSSSSSTTTWSTTWTSTGQPVSPANPATAAEASALAARFVTHLNANNSTAATKLACANSRQLLPTLIKTLLTPPTNLTPGHPIGQSPTFVIPLTGTTNNTQTTGILIIQQLPPAPLCVTAFQLTPS
ncbi:hypothetical protein [Kribbella solani]|uniref:Cytoskeletal protein RodZ n=1 Tax=Kribbella solani TaxID=236067 RepID=A0A841DV67_9ACTN|nr:hypothetical protein [Kribbella solani]MBB5981989.1 cytoskeletal protein RodZ [Kribbella solani]